MCSPPICKWIKGCNERYMLHTFPLEKQESEAWPPGPGAAAAAASSQPHPEPPAPTLHIAHVCLLTKAVKSYQEQLHSPNGNELFHHTSLGFDMNLSNNYQGSKGIKHPQCPGLCSCLAEAQGEGVGWEGSPEWSK